MNDFDVAGLLFTAADAAHDLVIRNAN